MRAATRLLRLLSHPLLLAAALGCAGDPPYDVVLANGRVMDPATGMDSLLHVGIRGDSIAALSATPPATSTSTTSPQAPSSVSSRSAAPASRAPTTRPVTP